MQQLCKRVIALQPVRSFRKACEFIADCGSVDFITVVRVCQPVASEALK